MNFPLAVVGRGAVTPAGIGLEALRAGRPERVLLSSVRNAKLAWPVLRVSANAPELARWQREPRLRRASPLSLFLIEAAAQALGTATEDERAQTGLLVALSAGCLVYTHRFFEGVLAQGRKMASPALFPETVFNSPGSHVAATLRLNGAASVLLGDETAWLAALRMAAVWLKQGRVRQVLIVGGEEFDPLMLDAYRSARWLGRPGMAGARGFMPGEGAAALLLRAAGPGDAPMIDGVRDGFLHRGGDSAARAAEKLFAGIEAGKTIWRTAAHNRMGALEEKMCAGRPGAAAVDPGPYLGEAFTASAGWQVLRALEAKADLVLPFWGLNHQLGRLEVRNVERRT
jgi:hypothetical protein